jgi:hypothetical protein
VAEHFIGNPDSSDQMTEWSGPDQRHKTQGGVAADATQAGVILSDYAIAQEFILRKITPNPRIKTSAATDSKVSQPATSSRRGGLRSKFTDSLHR